MRYRVIICLHLFIAAMFIPGLGMAQIDSRQSLVHTAQVWALAKYRHPQVTRCETNWDQALLDTIPIAAEANSTAELSQALRQMFNSVGGLNTSGDIGTAPDWIKTAALTETLKSDLAGLAAHRPGVQCYVAFSQSPSPDFSVDNGFNENTAFPNEPQRLLALFRLWGVIEYFFPYKDIIGRDWSDILYEALPSVIDADSQQSFHRALARFHHQINDGHSFYSSSAYPLNVYALLPLRVKTINGKSIVVKALVEAAPIRPGDEITAIDGIDIQVLKSTRSEDTHGSNPVSRDYWLHDLLLSRPLGLAALLDFRHPDGTSDSISLSADSKYYRRLAAGEGAIWRTVSPGNECRIGVVDMARLEESHLDALFSDLENADGIVFDLRNYPNGTAWGLVDRLFPTPRKVAAFDMADLNNPGSFQRTTLSLGNWSPLSFTGRILILVNEITLSQAEYSAMLLQAGRNAITIGSQTQGADGNVTSVSLPQNTSAVFTGLGVFYPDGRETQRIGIVPDIHVTPDIMSLSEGRDVVLETALDCELMTAAIPYRAARPGLFFDPNRDGEGIDLHLTTDQLVALNYTYAETGEPEWQLGAALRQRGKSGIDLYEYTYQAPGETQPEFWNTMELDFHRGPYDRVCAIADQARITDAVRFDLLTDDQQSPTCFRPIVKPTTAANQLNLSGAWYAGEADSGWGLSLQQSGDLLIVIAYLYDGDGRPRWLLGTANIADESAITMDVLQITGYCRTCQPTPISSEIAGTITLSPTVSTTNTASLQLTMDVQYRGKAPRQWQRDDIELIRLTPALPVDN